MSLGDAMTPKKTETPRDPPDEFRARLGELRALHAAAHARHSDRTSDPWRSSLHEAIETLQDDAVRLAICQELVRCGLPGTDTSCLDFSTRELVRSDCPGAAAALAALQAEAPHSPSNLVLAAEILGAVQGDERCGCTVVARRGAAIFLWPSFVLLSEGVGANARRTTADLRCSRCMQSWRRVEAKGDPGPTTVEWTLTGPALPPRPGRLPAPIPREKPAAAGEPDPAALDCRRCLRIPRLSGTVECGGRTTGALPPERRELETVRSAPDGSRGTELLRCPDCGAFYVWNVDYEFLIPASEDTHSLSRIPRDVGEEYRSGKRPLR
ncbi:MAG: hypothetical protein A3H96_22290 [Acidobacteria bacterium RIFCSPLOWO2_02_FULL_67_36]|nr:MAG: hypothetical protein A3H96_22290 [Acidobacteria bacterium RIFCSPLOWO2_02_FULL_67_36]OFW20277.1 MAG: hypothetical protein A3G21_26820 [Acidobacteria bacterium RIFCSPLOWO2_12_FULL_66_21]